MKSKQSRPEVLKSDVPMDEWPRCKFCQGFLRGGRKSYCCDECRRKDNERKATIREAVKKAKDERERERKENQKRWLKEREDRERLAKKEKKKRDTKIRRAKKAQRPKKKRKRRGIKPILDELICPNCGSKELKIQRPTPQEAAEVPSGKLPVMDIPTRWEAIETVRNRWWRKKEMPNRRVLGGLINPDTQYGIEISAKKTWRSALIHIASLISDGDIPEEDALDFFEMMSNALLTRNNVLVSPFVLRHLTRMHMEREWLLAEDRQHTQEMPKDVREYLIVKWIRALVFTKVRADPKKRRVACPRCYEITRWKGGQKEASNKDRDKELISTLKKGKGGGRQLWTHQRTDFGRALRSNEEQDVWVLCKRCKDKKDLTPNDKLRIATYKELAEETLSGKKTDPTGKTDRVARNQLVRIDGTIVCGKCGHYFGFGDVYDFSSGKDSAAPTEREATSEEYRKRICDVCRRPFYRPNGARGICEHCASKIYLEKGTMDVPCNCDIFKIYPIYLEEGMIHILCTCNIPEVYEVFLEEGLMAGPCDCEICALEFHGRKEHKKKSLAFTVGLPTTRRGEVVPRKIDKIQDQWLSEILRPEQWHGILRKVFEKDSIPIHIEREKKGLSKIEELIHALAANKTVPDRRKQRKSWADNISTSPLPPKQKQKPPRRPKLKRLDFTVGKFGSRELAEEYARERGGYCAGRETTAFGEVWLVFVKR